MASADTTAAAHNALCEELNELAGQSGLHMNSPVVLRLLYPDSNFNLPLEEKSTMDARDLFTQVIEQALADKQAMMHTYDWLIYAAERGELSMRA